MVLGAKKLVLKLEGKHHGGETSSYHSDLRFKKASPFSMGDKIDDPKGVAILLDKLNVHF